MRERLLLERLGQAARLGQRDGTAGEAIEQMLAAASEATAAAGATYVDIAGTVGCVVATAGDLEWVRGQRIEIGAEPDDASGPWLRPAECRPEWFTGPSRADDIGWVAGHRFPVSDRLGGGIYLYFRQDQPPDWDQTEPVLLVVAPLAASARRQAGPAPEPAPAETEAADQADDDRALFLAVAGHELRTPVTVVKGYAGILANRWDELDEAKRREAASVLSQRADQLARLVDRLLAATVADTSRAVRTVEFEPRPILIEAAAELPADQRRLVRLRLPDELPAVRGDPAALISIVAELVTNAARATSRAAARPAGPGSPTSAAIELCAGADASTVYVQVLDRGSGIDPAHTERAFERFFRAGRGDNGVGLGLYLVKRLVERQNGRVTLRQREGGGTVAEVRLPRADSPTSDETMP